MIKLKKSFNENNYDKILNWHKIHGNVIIDIKGCLYKSVYNKGMFIVDDIIFLYPNIRIYIILQVNQLYYLKNLIY